MSIITINNLRVNYGNFTALEITEPIEFKEGDRIGIIGSNGAGKTTFAKALTGLVNYQGDIKTDLTKDDIGIHLQQNGYIKRMPVKMIIETVCDCYIKDNKRLQEIIKFFDFESCLKKKFAQLSGGQQQKMTIILVLMHETKLTLFDEVTSGLDFEARAKLTQRIYDWYENTDNTVCFVSHYYDELEKLVNKLMIVESGRIAAFGEVEALFKKYCGEVVYIIANSEANIEAAKNFARIEAPAHLLAYACNTESEENKLSGILVKNDINFKRSNKDIEILFVNAVKSFREVNKLA
ncbi:MAG: ABC transporter ATP-binding protein [Firmicutes bacterium]|nr:ABC transporter ATP-binding protein [Bacillota bacterium]